MMSRHADPDATHFYRSLGKATGHGALALALVVGLYLGLANLGAGGREPTLVVDGRPDPSGTPLLPPEERDADGGGLPVDPATAAPAPAAAPPGATPGDEPDPPAAADPALVAAPPPSETTVQVIDGVGDGVAAEAAAQRLRDLGYQVVVVNPAAVDHASTQVWFTAGAEHKAQALYARDPRFGLIAPNHGLSETVDLHVVVGADWRR